MSTTKKTASSHKAARPMTLTTKTVALKRSFLAEAFLKIKNNKFVINSQLKIQNFLARRPHRSFQRTYRRDYVRSLNIPGYWAFTNYVRRILWENKPVVIWLAVVYCFVTVLIAGVASESTYTQVRVAIDSSSEELFTGVWGEIGKAGLIVAGGVAGAFNDVSADAQSSQQILLTLAGLLIWLTTVWILRAILAGHKPKLRDGLYNASAPLLSTFLVALVIAVQFLPLALAIFGYGAAVSSGLLEGGAEAMLFWSVAGLLALLSLYWMTSTAIALVVVTLPGMYPMQALRTAGDLVVGRRVRILLRLLWMALAVVITWLIVAIPIILFDEWLKSILPAVSWLPLVPIMLLTMSSLTAIWVASYIYLLYRKIVDDDALPA
jgi:hypothetical protein